MKEINKIDYLYVGGHKCGSTWLHDALIQHPMISMPLQKEPRFFDQNFEKGFDYYHSLWIGDGLRGEFSTSYFVDYEVIKRIYEYNPDIKILITIRDPFDRVCSHFKHWNRTEKIEDVNINDYIELYPEVIDRSLFARNIDNVLSFFPPEQVFINIFNDIRDTPSLLVSNIFDFLGVDDSFIPKRLLETTGKGFVPKSIVAEKIRHNIFNFLYQRRFQWVINFARGVGVGRFYRRINSKNVQLNCALDSCHMDKIVQDLAELSVILRKNFHSIYVQEVEGWIKRYDKGNPK